jgi:hypothetical protein
MKKVIALLQDVELFRTVQIIDKLYSVIYRDRGIQVIIRSDCRPRGSNIELWLNREDYVSRFSQLNYKPTSTMKYGYLGVKSIPGWSGDTDCGQYFLATPVTEKDGLNVERSCISLFVGHMNKCEDKLARWPECLDPSELEK